MEHRIILGGSEFLPFARSCVAKLKKLGMPYASQQYEINGVSIKVRIEPGHEYIRIDGDPYTEFAMDSGVVDLINVGANSPNRFAAGVLYPSTQVAAYNAAFTKSVPGGKTNTGATSGQFSGYLKVFPSRVQGTIFNKAYSFYPRQKILSALDALPVVWGADPEDSNVWAKKLAVNRCPASMFTGKTRLYVQAIYGKPLYKRNPLNEDGSESGATIGNADIPSTGGGTSGSPPYLSLPGYIEEGSSESSPNVDIGTSSGVYLHPATGKHFLMVHGGGKLYVYPLISSKPGESLRRYIKSGSSLSVANQERCEAYILAYSKPDVSEVVVVNDAWDVSINTWSLGYGWHWNWSGTKATLTSWVTEVFGQSMETTILYRSSRYEMSATINVIDKVIDADGVQTVIKNGAFTATASTATIESNVYWYALRGYVCIAEPDWFGGMIKSTNRFNREYYPCDAPFYSFYKRDSLQVARVKIERASIAAVTETYSSEVFRSGRFTTGAQGGFATSNREYVAELRVTFSCGGASVAFESGSGQTMRDTYGGKTFGAHANEGNLWDPPWYPGWFGSPPQWLKYYVQTGYPNEYGVWATTDVSTFPPAAYGVPILYSFAETRTETDKYTIGAVEAVAPIYDAEALFLYGKQVTELVVDRTVITTYTGQGYASENGGVRVYTQGSIATNSPYTADEVHSPVQRDDTTVEAAYLVYSGGVTPARADLLKIGLEDYGGDGFPLGATVFTGASTNVVVSGYINNSVGTDRTGELLSMVGWV